MWGRPRSDASTSFKVIALLLFAASCVATLVAALTYEVMCVNYEGADACLGRPTEFALYLALSLIGSVAAGLMLHFAFRGPRSAFVAFLVAGVAIHTVSILFADAGTHGWDDLKAFPPFS